MRKLVNSKDFNNSWKLVFDEYFQNEETEKLMALSNQNLLAFMSKCMEIIPLFFLGIFINEVTGKEEGKVVVCEERGSMVFCQNVIILQNGNLSEVDVSVELNECHHPSDVTFNIQTSKWKWKHTFINDNEVHKVTGPVVYTLLQVIIQRPSNQTVSVQANFLVNGEKQAMFFNHNFTATENITCPVFLKQIKRTVKDLLPLIIFIALCALIVITLIGFILWYRLKQKRKPSSPHHKLGSSSSRPVSSAYSYEEEDYIEEPDKKKQPRNNKSSTTTVIRNSIYRESLLLDESSTPYTFFTHEDDIKFNSLPRHFGGQTWIPVDDTLSAHETRTLPRKCGFESPQIPPKEISAKDYLNINSGTSQPHYSATMFQSFRGTVNSPNKNTNHDKPKRRTNDNLYNSSSSFSNSSSPCTPKGARQKHNGTKKRMERDDLGKRLSSVRLLHDHDHMDNDNDEDDHEPSDHDPLKSSKY